jgi:FkbM family methyltransferase
MISYAQNFEDVILSRALKHIKNGFYIDIGAQDPIIDSVSRSFYEQGWRGIHIEPSPQYAEALRRNRPDEDVFECALGSSERRFELFHFPDTGLSTGVEEIASRAQDSGFQMEKIVINLRKTSDLLNIYKDKDIHWMKIDCEGMEIDVIEGWHGSDVRPWIVVVESIAPITRVPSYEEWEGALIGFGYEFVYSDALNRFYISAEHRELKQAFGPGANCFDDFALAPFHGVLRFAEREIAAQQKALASLSRAIDDVQSRDAQIAQAKVRIKALEDQLQRVARDRDAEKALNRQLDKVVAAYENQLTQQAAALVAEREIAAAHGRLSQVLEERIAEASNAAAALKYDLARVTGELAEARVTAEHWRHELQSVHESTSWRFSAPIRWIKITIGFLIRRLALAPGSSRQKPALTPGPASPVSLISVVRADGLRQLTDPKTVASKSPVFLRAEKHFDDLMQSRNSATKNQGRT